MGVECVKYNPDKSIVYSSHQLIRMAQRGISKDLVHCVLSKGEWTRGKSPFSFQVTYKGLIVVVYENKKEYNVSTCKLDRKLTLKAEGLKKYQNYTFLSAIKEIVKRIDF